MRIFWHPFYVTCSGCGYRNRPSKSPREGVRLALMGQLPDCRGCGALLGSPSLPDRPLVHEVRAELAEKGIQAVC